jgi:predicted PurR-regulated permease PerM
MRLRQPNWTRILTILLVILAFCALLYIAGIVLFRFTHVIVLFVLGAITAYVLTPVVNALQTLFRLRWLAIFLSYLLVAGLLFAIGVMLVTPFVQQAQSLVDNLHAPVPGSLKTLGQSQSDMTLLQGQLVNLKLVAQPGATQGSQSDIEQAEHQVQVVLGRLTGPDMTDLRNGTLQATSHASAACRARGPEKLTPCPGPQTQVPPSYVKRVQNEVNLLNQDFQTVTQDVEAAIRSKTLDQAINRAKQAGVLVGQLKHQLSTTPILLLRLQTFLDDHGIQIDLPNKLGDAAEQVSSQGSNILNNAITIVQKTLNLLLNTVLILIIAFYLLLDGPRLIRGGMRLVPAGHQDQVWYFVRSLDRVMGGYIRGTIFLSALAGVLAGGGAAVLGVPYPLLIGLVTFLLMIVPVIGPMVAMFPAIIISLFFMPLFKTIILAAYFIVFMQLVTNVLGPRIMGIAVGIHPLEALFAVLVGYPVGGILGAFLAVPVMGIIHILIREAYNYFVLGQAMPREAAPEPEPAEGAPAPAPLATTSTRDSPAS